MINFDEVANENQTIHISQSYIPDHPYRMLIIGSSVWYKHISKYYKSSARYRQSVSLCKRFRWEKYKFLIKECEDVG